MKVAPISAEDYLSNDMLKGNRLKQNDKLQKDIDYFDLLNQQEYLQKMKIGEKT